MLKIKINRKKYYLYGDGALHGGPFAATILLRTVQLLYVEKITKNKYSLNDGNKRQQRMSPDQAQKVPRSKRIKETEKI